MNKLTRLVACYLLSVSIVNARSLQDRDPSPTPTPAPVIIPQPAPAPAVAPAQPSINPAAAAGQQSQSNGADANKAAGTALIAAGAALMTQPPTVPAGVALMIMGMMAMKQGNHDDNAANQSGQTYGTSLQGSGSSAGVSTDASTTAANAPVGSSSTGGFAPPPQVAQALQDAGYALNAQGVVAPDGSVTPYSAYSSPGAMAAAGLDANAVNAAKGILAKVDSQYAGKIGKMEGGGGGAVNEAGEPIHNAEPQFKNPWDLTNAQKANMVAGKTRSLDGEPIGVRAQNIFEMVHTAYEKKRKNKDFIEPLAPVVKPMMAAAPRFVGRAPASLKTSHQPTR